MASAKNLVDNKKEKKPSQITVQVKTDTLVGSKYSQAVGVSVTDTDVTLEFVYLNPRDKKGEVVSRVTLPIKAGQDMATVILNTINLHIAKMKGEKND